MQYTPTLSIPGIQTWVDDGSKTCGYTLYYEITAVSGVELYYDEVNNKI